MNVIRKLKLHIFQKIFCFNWGGWHSPVNPVAQESAGGLQVQSMPASAI